MQQTISSKKNVLSLAISAAVSLSLLSATHVHAQANDLILEEVLVTAQFRSENLQDVPVSVSAIGGDKIYEAGIGKIEDLQAYVPNLTMSETGIGTNIYIRGIGSGINQGFEQSAGMYVDGVYHGRAQLARTPFLDLERVEVLRGPQNILYGKNSIAGALSLITQKPTSELEGYFSTSILVDSDEDDEEAEFVISGPITDKLSARFATKMRRATGFIDNLTTGDTEPDRDEKTYRLQFAYDVNENFDLNLKIERSKFDVEGRQVEVVGERDSLNPALSDATWSEYLLNFSQIVGYGADATVLNTDIDFERSANEDFSENDITNITLSGNYYRDGYVYTGIFSKLKYDYDELCDCDFTGADLFFVESQEEYDQTTFEFRVTSPVGEEFEWISGVYYQDSKVDFNDAFFTTPQSIVNLPINAGLASALGAFYPGTSVLDGPANQLIDFAVPREFSVDSELYSVFGQVTWSLQDNLRLTFGGRYSSEEKDGARSLDFATRSTGVRVADDTSFVPATSMGIDYLLLSSLKVARQDLEGDYDEDNFAPLINIEYDLNDDVLLYGTWTKGFKSGGYDTRSNLPDSVTTFGAGPIEVSEGPGSFEYEEEEAITLELGAKTVFMNGQGELNIAAFITEYEDLQVSIYDGVLGFNVGNAAEATTVGIELDGRYRATANSTFIFSLAFLDFEFDEFPNGQCTQAERIAEDLDGDAVGGSDIFCDFEGKSNQYVADFSGAVAYDYLRPLDNGWEFRSVIDVTFTDDYNPSQNLDPEIEQDGYAKTNVRFALGKPDSWEAAVAIRNLGDKEIITYANDLPLAANLSQAAGYYAFVEQGRNLSLQLRLMF